MNSRGIRKTAQEILTQVSSSIMLFIETYFGTVLTLNVVEYIPTVFVYNIIVFSVLEW